ncbi:unnamed protein product [Acanthoscelides obtectus]|uniref:Mos1 transposase HTH domain-containing protein n=1 Tax=Acanthoscelides obtectus TaxID=200917 RepID=A0A9P0JXE8_ACAOB|nr:unnamed protein product [Acanthoscelides obtectus]CAK1647109.1 Histone-lysine N-methyltransferase SETMAR [Acanthoscelides obtectus]
MELNREYFRAIIYYNFQRQLSQQECLAELLSVFGNEAPHQSTISRWHGEFKRGRVSLTDDPRVGAPKTAVAQENVDAVRKLIIEDRHASLKISKTSIQKILHEELGVRKLISRWIPHLLTEEQKAARVNCIVGDDESWIYCYEPENKRQLAVWVFQCEEKPTKVIRSRVSKKMVATFVSKAVHIATIPLNEQRTVTADWYSTICLPKVITELRKINPERRIILHPDNARSHTTQKTRQYLTEENVELLDYPPYSPDLSPNDFFTFPKIKNRLRGQRFQSPEEAVDAFKNAVLDLPANELRKLVRAHADAIRKLETVCGVSRRTVQRSLKAHSFHPYKIHLVQELNEDDFDRRLQFYEDMINRHNCRYWFDSNPRIYHEVHTQQPQKLNVWANTIDPALTAIIENQNDRRYIANRLIFQQDGAPPHYALRVRKYLDQTFPDRWIGRRGAIEWPPRSPDLSPLDFFMWGDLKGKIYATQPTSLEDLRQRIVNECLQITPQILQNVRQRFEQNLYYCMESHGGHFQHLLA